MHKSYLVSDRVAPGPHRTDSAIIGFWKRMEAIDVPVDATLAGERLNRIHQALRCYEQPLPSLMDDLIPFVRERWAAGRATSPLPQASQRFLEEAESPGLHGSKGQNSVGSANGRQTVWVNGEAITGDWPFAWGWKP